MRINCHRTGHNRRSRLCVHVTDNQTRYRAPPLRGQNSLRPLKNYDAMSGVLEMEGPVKEKARQFGLSTTIPDDRFFPTLGTAVAAWKAQAVLPPG
jgi:hypothetical protein